MAGNRMRRDPIDAIIDDCLLSHFQRDEPAKPTYAQLAAQVTILTAERDAVIRQRDAWSDAYHSLAKLLHVPEC